MQKRLNKIAIDTNNFLKKYLKKQNKTDLIKPMSYGLFSGGKKIRSKIIYDIGSIFKINDFAKLALFFCPDESSPVIRFSISLKRSFDVR